MFLTWTTIDYCMFAKSKWRWFLGFISTIQRLGIKQETQTQAPQRDWLIHRSGNCKDKIRGYNFVTGFSKFLRLGKSASRKPLNIKVFLSIAILLASLLIFFILWDLWPEPEALSEKRYAHSAHSAHSDHDTCSCRDSTARTGAEFVPGISISLVSRKWYEEGYEINLRMFLMMFRIVYNLYIHIGMYMLYDLYEYDLYDLLYMIYMIYMIYLVYMVYMIIW